MAADAPRHWLIVLAEAEGLRWVAENRRMAFSESLGRRARRMRPGDRLVLYVSRGAFHNPTRDRSKLAGLDTVASPVARLRRPLDLAGRRFVWACDLTFEALLPPRQGVPVEPLLDRLSFVKRREAWGQYFRAGLLELSDTDFRLMATEITLHAPPGPPLRAAGGTKVTGTCR